MAVTISGTDGISSDLPLKLSNGTEGAPALTGQDTDSGVFFGTNQVNISTNGSTVATANSSGNLGLGTTSASDKLSVAGSVSGEFRALTLRNSSGVTNSTASLTFEASAGTEGDDAAIAAQIKGVRLGSGTNGGLQFWTAKAGVPAQRMQITKDGELQIGTTATSTSRLFVVAASSASAARLQVSANATGAIDFHNASGGYVASVIVNASSVAYNTTSDYRLKENVTPVTDGITRLQQLSPSRFNFIADPDKTVDGFLAHEVQTIVPEAITGEKDAVDDEGNPVMQGIDQSKLVPLLTAALKEAITKIETLESQHADLLARVTALEAAE